MCTVIIISGIATGETFFNNPPNVPSNPHPEDGTADIGVKTHLSWTGGDPDSGDKATYDLYFGTNDNPSLVASDLEKPNYYPGVLEHITQYYWKVIAKDKQGSTTNGPLWTFITNDCDCDPPEKPSGPTRARNRHRYEYSTKIMNQNQNGWYYNFSWGDGNYSGWIGPYNYNVRARAEYEWEEPGIYQIQTRARIKNGFEDLEEWITTGWSEPLLVTVSADNPSNNVPNAPQINGPLSGKTGIMYDFTFLSTDPDNDDLYYIISWGCCSGETHEYGPYASGEEAIISHSWSEQGKFTIVAKAKDVYESESPESTYEITIPRTKDAGGNKFMQRIKNMICDMLGICQRGCDLVELNGILTYDGTNFFIEFIELHFGPKWYITLAVAAKDYDGDGNKELVIDELRDLIGSIVTVEGHMQSESWMSVFIINDLVYREPGQPVWTLRHQWCWRNRNNHP